MRQRILLPFLVLGALVAVTPPADAATTVVSVGPPFSPSPITISPGDTVRFQNTGGFHSVTASDGTYDSGGFASGFFEHAYATAGTYSYYCVYHGSPSGTGHAGVVIVSEAPPPAVPELPVPALAAGLAGLTLVVGSRHRRLRGHR